MRKTLFLNPPSFEGFDGGAGARYQARREVRSFWFPTWLAHPAALVAGSKLIDAPPAGLTLEQVLPAAKEHELANTIAGLTGGPAEHAFEATRAGDVRSSTADVTQVTKELSWRPACTLDHGIGATIDWFREKLGA